MPLNQRARAEIRGRVNDWFDAAARDLPWRRPDAGAWPVLVSEFMLQQTSVVRVLPYYLEWIERWPTPEALAAEPASAAVSAWGRLGYPRRAQRLHACAQVITAEHGGVVPREIEVLRTLPGIGDYTAAAVATFAHGQPHVVLDVNVRRVLARVESGIEFPPGSPTRAERTLAAAWVDGATDAEAVRWAAASMELGALICTATNPACERCPISDSCAWLAAGQPRSDAPRRTQTYVGTDRHCRGHLLELARTNPDGIAIEDALTGWPDREQAERALASLAADGLITLAGRSYSL